MLPTIRQLLIGLAFLAMCGTVHASGPAALGAAGPVREYADKLMFFGQFVGDWEFDMTATKPDGSQVTGKGEWYFGWVLDGRAPCRTSGYSLVLGSPNRVVLGSTAALFVSTIRTKMCGASPG